MELKNLTLSSVLYYMQSFTISTGNTSFDIPRSMITNIEISKDFITSIYPMYYVSVNVPIWFYTEITNNIDNTFVTMNLQYKTGGTNEKLTENPNGLITEISGKFKAVLPYTTPISDFSSQNTTEKQDGAYKKNYTSNQYAIVELALYNIASYNASFKTINTVISSANITDIFGYCATALGLNNILMSKSDNTRIYSEFKILPSSGIKNILRVVEDYNFHSDGSVIFFDLTEAYLITQKVGCYAWRNNEYKSTHFLSLSEFSNTMGRFDGIYINSKEKYNIISVERDSFQTESLTSSPLTDSVAQNEFISIHTTSATMGMLTPNKEFIVSIDAPSAKKINGKYRMYSYTLTLKPSGEYLSPSFKIILCR